MRLRESESLKETNTERTFAYLLDITCNPARLKFIEQALRAVLQEGATDYTLCLDMAVNSNPADAEYDALPGPVRSSR